jgi:hypothetical protein
MFTPYFPSCARRKAAMSHFFIFMKALVTRSAFAGSLSESISERGAGTTCHDRPNLSFGQPQATLFAAVGELAPVVVDLVLRFAVDLKRDRLVELELRAAVERHELLSLDLELYGHDRSRGLAVDLMSRLSIAIDASDLGVLEDRDVEIRRRLGLVVEPQQGVIFCAVIAMMSS